MKRKKKINIYLIAAIAVSVIGAGAITFLHKPMTVAVICE